MFVISSDEIYNTSGTSSVTECYTDCEEPSDCPADVFGNCPDDSCMSECPDD